MLLAYSGCLFLDFLGSLVSIYLHMWVIKIDIDDKYKMFHKCIQSVYYILYLPHKNRAIHSDLFQSNTSS